MGIVNLTPDSFSDGGCYSFNTTTALRHAEKLVEDGADILDVGGESTRPGAVCIPEKQEWKRIKEVLGEIRRWQLPISLDTRKSWIMQQALDSGVVDIVNDVEALRGENSIKVLRQAPSVAIVLMHMQGNPQSMQEKPVYGQVVEEVIQFLHDRIAVCVEEGIQKQRLLVDPGFGFGKTLEHNLSLLRNLAQFNKSIGRPVVIGLSRKRMFESIAGEKEPQQRIGSGVVAEIEGVRRGASIIRTHNVRQTRQGLLTYRAINGS
ncbi:MAG: dihydropteroate synthase [Neisseriaceae bacterium]